MIKIVFMGTPDFAVPSLRMLIDEGYDVVAVVTRKDTAKGRGMKVQYSPVKQFALSKGIPVFQPDSAKSNEFVEKIREIKPDLMVTAAYGRILPKEILDIPTLGCINVHASLLPEYRGAAPIHKAIIDGKSKTGITTMMTDVGMDTGDILIKNEVEIPRDMITGELHDLLAELGVETLKETVFLLMQGKLVRVPQDDNLASYAPQITRETGCIDWNDSAENIYNRIRGTNPWPGSYTTYCGGRMKIWKAELGEQVEGACGEIIEVGDQIVVATRDGSIRILEVQFDNGKRMSVKNYLMGHSVETGKILGDTIG